MDTMRMYIPAEILSGQGVVEEIGGCARQHGTRVLLVSEVVLQEEGVVQLVQQQLEAKGLNCLVFDEISTKDAAAGIQEAIQVGHAGKVQMVVSVGGMRAIAAGRAASLAIASNCSYSELLESERPWSSALPCLEIPTSYRNPLQFYPGTILAGPVSREPRLLTLPRGFLRCVIIDPELTMTLSGKYSAALAMDAVLSGIEGYISHAAGYLGRPLLRDGVGHCSEAVLGLYNAPEDPRHRMRAAEGGLLISLGLAFGRQGIGGALVYALNSMFGVPKSWVAAVLAPHIAEFWIPSAPQLLADLAGAMGADVANLSAVESARQVPQVLRRMIGQVELPGRLRELDIQLGDVREAVDFAMGLDMIGSGPHYPQHSDVLSLVKRAY